MMWVFSVSVNMTISFLCFRDDSLSIISLYQLAYNKKTMYSNYGAFYEVKLIFGYNQD